MSFFSWMRLARQQPLIPLDSPVPKPAHPDQSQRNNMNSFPGPMEPALIADAVEAMSRQNKTIARENERAQRLCLEADTRIKTQQEQLTLLREKVRSLQASNEALAAKIKMLEKRPKEPPAAQVAQVQQKCDALQNEMLELRALARAHQYVVVYNDTNASADATSTFHIQSILPSVPFVVILVDADSYHFQTVRNGKSATENQGAQMAHNLRTEISKYILSHPRIPPLSKIVCRIMCNCAQNAGKIIRKRKMDGNEQQKSGNTLVERKPNTTVETMIKLAETLCNDNGYARMLERYDGNLTAAAKIILLTNGEVTREMQNLSFPKVELAGVFQPRYSKKRDQGSAAKSMGPLVPISHLPGQETSKSYDVDYSARSSNAVVRVNALLQDLRISKKQAKAIDHANTFARLPYETDERYEERLIQKLFPSSSRSDVMMKVGPSSTKGGKRDDLCVAHLGLLHRKETRKPVGIASTAPLLPFLILSSSLRDARARTAVTGVSLPPYAGLGFSDEGSCWNEETSVEID